MALQNSPIKSKTSKKFILIFGGILLLSIFMVVYFRYYYVYSDGTRVGILYKFSRKGTVFKTYEGEMMLPGLRSKMNSPLSTNTFNFSVTDKELAIKLTKLQGQELELRYTQYNNSLVWRGDSYDEQDGQYVVDKLERIINKNPRGYGL
jgi:hypothetical protein